MISLFNGRLRKAVEENNKKSHEIIKQLHSISQTTSDYIDVSNSNSNKEYEYRHDNLILFHVKQNKLQG